MKVFAAARFNSQRPLHVRYEFESNRLFQCPRIVCKVTFGITATLRFPMKIAIFDIESDDNEHGHFITSFLKLRTTRLLCFRGVGTLEFEDNGIAQIEEIHREIDQHIAPPTGVRNEFPDRRRSGLKLDQVSRTQLGNKPVCIRPEPHPLDQNVTIHGERGVKIRTQHAIVFRFNTPKVDAHASHCTPSIREQNQRRFNGIQSLQALAHKGPAKRRACIEKPQCPGDHFNIFIVRFKTCAPVSGDKLRCEDGGDKPTACIHRFAMNGGG